MSRSVTDTFLANANISSTTALSASNFPTKGRRNITNALKEKLKAFNISVLDISGEYVKETDIAFVFLSPDSRHGAQYLQKIEAMIERHFGEYVWGGVAYEML